MQGAESASAFGLVVLRDPIRTVSEGNRRARGPHAEITSSLADPHRLRVNPAVGIRHSPVLQASRISGESAENDVALGCVRDVFRRGARAVDPIRL
jgi:hypothetical protein